MPAIQCDDKGLHDKKRVPINDAVKVMILENARKYIAEAFKGIQMYRDLLPDTNADSGTRRRQANAEGYEQCRRCGFYSW